MNEVGTKSLFNQLVGHPYFWMTLAIISGLYFFIRLRSPEKVEWIELLLEGLLDIFIYAVTFQYLKDSNGPTEKLMSLFMAGGMLFLLYKIIMNFV